MKFIFSENLSFPEAEIKKLINNFSSGGDLLSDGRNQIRIYELDHKKINIKSFKLPNTINKVVYRFFRIFIKNHFI